MVSECLPSLSPTPLSPFCPAPSCAPAKQVGMDKSLQSRALQAAVTREVREAFYNLDQTSRYTTQTTDSYQHSLPALLFKCVFRFISRPEVAFGPLMTQSDFLHSALQLRHGHTTGTIHGAVGGVVLPGALSEALGLESLCQDLMSTCGPHQSLRGGGICLLNHGLWTRP